MPGIIALVLIALVALAVLSFAVHFLFSAAFEQAGTPPAAPRQT